MDTRSSPQSLLRAAARDNASWCARVAASHGVHGRFTEAFWASPRRTPPFYPDAVTLQPGCPVDALLRVVDTATPGCAVKDSFSDLDLEPSGFRVLLHGLWIAREAAARGAAGWRLVRDDADLVIWESAWAGDAGPDIRLFLPSLLAHADVAFVTTEAGGGILSRSGDVVGVSNVFGDDGTWPVLVAAAAELFPGLPLVGWEAPGDLAPAQAAGFAPCGELRVWAAG